MIFQMFDFRWSVLLKDTTHSTSSQSNVRLVPGTPWFQVYYHRTTGLLNISSCSIQSIFVGHWWYINDSKSMWVYDLEMPQSQTSDQPMITHGTVRKRHRTQTALTQSKATSFLFLSKMIAKYILQANFCPIFCCCYINKNCLVLMEAS